VTVNNLNGWQRLAVVSMGVWTLYVGVITWQRWPDADSRQSEQEIAKFRNRYLDDNGNLLPPSFVPDKPVYYDKNGAPIPDWLSKIPDASKSDNWKPPTEPIFDMSHIDLSGIPTVAHVLRVRAARDALMLWLLPPFGLFSTWFTIVWVYRGFRPRSA
jgi:hypothetical protein